MKKLLLSVLIIGVFLALIFIWFEGKSQISTGEPVDAEPSAGSGEVAVCPGERAFEKGAWDIAYREFSGRAATGDAAAQHYLGLMYVRGLGLQQNTGKGIRWLHRAAEQNLPEAHYSLGLLAYRGRALPKNYHEAFDWFQRAALLNHAEAQYFLGTMYNSGRGTTIDAQAGHAWLNLSSDNGHDPAADTLSRNGAPPEGVDRAVAELRDSVADSLRQTDLPKGAECAR